MYVRPVPSPSMRVQTARSAQHWWTCLPYPERFWADTTTNPINPVPQPLIADIVDTSFLGLLGETYGTLRRDIFLEAFGYVEEVIPVGEEELRVYNPVGDWWTAWQQTRADYPAFDEYTCEMDSYD